jgi:hypothetical protein
MAREIASDGLKLKCLMLIVACENVFLPWPWNTEVFSHNVCTFRTILPKCMKIFHIPRFLEWQNEKGPTKVMKLIYNNSQTNAQFSIFTQLFYIKSSDNSYMFWSLKDHHQGVCTSMAVSYYQCMEWTI